MAAFLSGGSPVRDVTTQCWAVTLCCRFDFVTAFRDRQLDNERRGERNDVQRRTTFGAGSMTPARWLRQAFAKLLGAGAHAEEPETKPELRSTSASQRDAL